MNIGVIGTGFIVEAFMSGAEAAGGVSFKGIYSRNSDSERVAYLKETYHIDKAYGDLDAMLANPEIDFIYVASPNSLHYPQSLKALQAGKNVICEKPYTSTLKEAAHLLEVAKKNNVMIFEAIITIHVPNFNLIRENLPRLGALRIAQLNFSQYSSRYDKFLAGEVTNVFDPVFSGGCLQDINIYNVHFMAGLFGMPDNAVYFPNIQKGVDTSGIMIMQYPGFTASLVGAKDTKSENFVYIQGEKGYMRISGANGCQEICISLNGASAPVILNCQYEQNRLYYEILAFQDIYQRKDYARCYELAEYSNAVIGLVEETRKAAGVYFAADKEA